MFRIHNSRQVVPKDWVGTQKWVTKDIIWVAKKIKKILKFVVIHRSLILKNPTFRKIWNKVTVKRMALC